MTVLQRSALPAHLLQAPAGEVDKAQTLRIALRLAPRCGDEALIARAFELGAQPLAQRRHMDLRAPDADVRPADEALDAVRSFCREHGFTLERMAFGGLFVSISGKAGELATAFGVTLRSYRYEGHVSRGYEGSLTLPDIIAPHVRGVLGLDDIARTVNARQAAEARSGRTADRGEPMKADEPARPAATAPRRDRAGGEVGMEPPSHTNNLPTTVAFDYYDYPSQWTGKGATVAFIEQNLAVGVEEVQAYYQSLGLGPVDIKLIHGGPLTPVKYASTGTTGRTMAATREAGAPPMKPIEPPPMKSIFNGEAMMDLKLTGSVAPDARLVVYGQGENYNYVQDNPWIDTLLAALDSPEYPCQAVSISLGGPEYNYGLPTVDGIQLIFALAALGGVTVCIASGDFGAVGHVLGENAYQQNCAFPASSSLCLACGGTELLLDPATEPDQPPALQGEVVWNTMQYVGDKAATGGGISMLFPVPTYQQGYTLPAPQNTKVNQGPGRGVPDVAANASPDSGYGLTIDHTGRFFGTSAAAPMWAGLIALLVEGNGGKPVGFLNPLLYRLQAEGAQVCTPILIGNNIAPGSDIGFQAGAPWNACCGLGSPLGTTIAKNLGLMES